MDLSLKQQLGQLLIMGLKGSSLSSEEKEFIITNNIGGVILFSRNIENPKQLQLLISEIQSLRHLMHDKCPLFVSVDMEGGRVARLKSPFTQWPPIQKLGNLDSASLCFKFAETMGKELISIGFNLDFAPCLDILTNSENKVIGDRSLSSNPELVAKLGSALVRGYIKSDILPCAKHFPGHGNTLLDSHEALPVEDKTDLKRLHEVELVPFKRAFRARLDLIMSCHVMFPKIDPDWPVTLSEVFLKKILREELGFRGLVVSDDLDMKALANNFAPDLIPVRALQAGIDILLYCNEHDKPPMAIQALQKALQDGVLDKNSIQDKYSKILQLKKTRIKHVEPLDLQELSRVLGHPDHLQLAKAIVAGEIPSDLTT